jgi:hypothetical protein
MTDFTNLDRANAWLHTALGVVRDCVHAAGPTWNEPSHREARERSVRLVTRAVKRVDRAADDLTRNGAPEAAVRDRAFRRPGRDRAARPVTRTPAHARASR